jgi:lipopolysaccharide export system protein LptA
MLFAAITPAQQPMPVELSADRAEINDAQGTGVYRGNVVLTRGQTRLTGSVMRTFTDEARRLQRVEIEGSPARYRALQPQGPPRRAEAPRMEYYAAAPERLVLLGGGRVWEGDNSVTGEVITHYPDSQRTVADGEDQGRIKVRVFPGAETAQ